MGRGAAAAHIEDYGSGIYNIGGIYDRDTVEVRRLKFRRSRGTAILKYDLGSHCLSVIGAPDVYEFPAVLMSMHDGSLGLAGIRGSTLYLWSRKVNPVVENIGWVQYKVIELEKLLAIDWRTYMRINVICFTEGVNAIVMDTGYSTFAFELDSGRVSKLRKHMYSENMSFPS
ncbi:hypothetical protein QOZ80_7AG0554500 [Eleusine coracana subsp. coracana]|nr:hypothetical protein QOZ80_7AG0554500 [Eleusine coracana subsp. coracana]